MRSVAKALPFRVLSGALAAVVLATACASSKPSERGQLRYTPSERARVDGGPVCVVESFDADAILSATRRSFGSRFQQYLRDALRSELEQSTACGELVLLDRGAPDPAAAGRDGELRMDLALWSGGWNVAGEPEGTFWTDPAFFAALTVPPFLLYVSIWTAELRGDAQLVVQLKHRGGHAEVVRVYVGEFSERRSILSTFYGAPRRIAFQAAYRDALGQLREDLPAAAQELSVELARGE